MARTLIHIPPQIRRGDVFEVRTTIAHPMETGYRVNDSGQVAPRDIIRRLSCQLDLRVCTRCRTSVRPGGATATLRSFRGAA